MQKAQLLKLLQKDWKKYWYLDFFRQNGFKRYICGNCGKAFWALQEQERCNDSSCRPYDFIGSPIGKKYDYFKTWKVIRDFFVNQGHAEIPRYPTVCRWYPLYFTIAGIVNFYRLENSNLSFEFPANPLIMNQPCLRFNDIPNVGVSGRHFSCFNMVQQSALYDGRSGYWKEKCIELDYRLLTEVFKIAPEEINFIEDVWLGHLAFGYSLEFHVRGLELGNAVFTEFMGEKLAQMKNKIIDMGAGHERFTWLTHGTPTAYDIAFGPVIEKMAQRSGLSFDRGLLLRYAKISGILNLDEVSDIEAARASIASRLGLSVDQLKEQIEPMQALYAIADHSRCLLYALCDGGLPSNIGGGYNLRVVLRRALSFIDRHALGLDLVWVCTRLARYLKRLHPELKERLEHVKDVLQIEEKRYRAMRERSKAIIQSLIGKKIGTQKLVELYDSHGITPELLAQAASECGQKLVIPPNFYALVAERHLERQKEKKRSLNSFPKTQKLCYEPIKRFTAKVLGIIQNKVILDKSAFYPRGGGQEPDHGSIAAHRVYDVEEQDGVVIHFVEEPDFKVGDIVECEIDWDRRAAITAHHDATHIINGAARKVLGYWVWQEGSKKDQDKGHLDIAHYKHLSEQELSEIERLANDIVRRAIKIEKFELSRPEAERRFGFRIYQGGAVPKSTLRLVKIGDFDIEACAGTHGDSTAELRKIIITKVERPSDGIVRFIFRAGQAAQEYERKMALILKECATELGVHEHDVCDALVKLIEKWKAKRKKLERARAAFAKACARKLKFKRIGNFRVLLARIEGVHRDVLREISRLLSADDTIIILFGVCEKIEVFGSCGPKPIKAGIHIGKLLSSACACLGGKGGGDAKLAQGIGMKKSQLKVCLEKLESEINEKIKETG